jgi:hypothetical protein
LVFASFALVASELPSDCSSKQIWNFSSNAWKL